MPLFDDPVFSDKSLEAEERPQVQAAGEGKSEPAEQKESSDDGEGDSDSEDEPRTAPNELLMEVCLLLLPSQVVAIIADYLCCCYAKPVLPFHLSVYLLFVKRWTCNKYQRVFSVCLPVRQALTNTQVLSRMI